MTDLSKPVSVTVIHRVGVGADLFVGGIPSGRTPDVPRDGLETFLAATVSTLEVVALRPLEAWSLFEGPQGDTVSATAEFAWVRDRVDGVRALAEAVQEGGPREMDVDGTTVILY